ncbi:MAG: TIGR03668 family PPOX class F420-dependent oxidoreductase [Acidimicrobiales bacterium]
MDRERARSLVEGARVAHLATVRTDGRAHLVPVTFAVTGRLERLVTAVDWKPKRGGELARVANVRRTGTATVLVDHYDDADWSALWWVRLAGPARVVDPGTDTHARAIAALVARYAQYAARPPEGPAIEVVIAEWRGWSAVDPPDDRHAPP